MSDQYSIHATRRNGSRGAVDVEVSLGSLLDLSFTSTPALALTRGVAGWGQTSALATDLDGATITFDLNQSISHTVTLNGNRTLALANPTIGLIFNVYLVQGTGSNLVTWFAGIKWPGGVVPTLTITAGKTDFFQFICLSTGGYLNHMQALNC